MTSNVYEVDIHTGSVGGTGVTMSLRQTLETVGTTEVYFLLVSMVRVVSKTLEWFLKRLVLLRRNISRSEKWPFLSVGQERGQRRPGTVIYLKKNPGRTTRHDRVGTTGPHEGRRDPGGLEFNGRSGGSRKSGWILSRHLQRGRCL